MSWWWWLIISWILGATDMKCTRSTMREEKEGSGRKCRRYRSIKDNKNDIHQDFSGCQFLDLESGLLEGTLQLFPDHRLRSEEECTVAWALLISVVPLNA